MDLNQALVAQAPLANLLRNLLSDGEQEQIKQQFDHECRRDSQVLWSGVPREVAQAWADNRKLQTLTTAMGPLMDTRHPSCLKPKKSPRQWSIYMKGASALFACHITRSSKVTVLSPPPPEKLNPSGHTNYQLIEEPILKGIIGGHSVGCIQMVHPTVGGAEEFSYQSWPVDRTEEWTENFPHPTITRISWRTVKIQPEMQHIIAIVAVAERCLFYAESVAGLPSQVFAEQNASTEKKQKGSEAPNKCLSRVYTNALQETKLGTSQLQDKTQVVKKKAREEKVNTKKAKEEKAKKAREEKAKRKRVNEEREQRARKEKAERKRANEEKEQKAREEKAKRKRANEEREQKAREERAKRKKANEEREQKAREEKAKRKRANKETEKKARMLCRAAL